MQKFKRAVQAFIDGTEGLEGYLSCWMFPVSSVPLEQCLLQEKEEGEKEQRNIVKKNKVVINTNLSIITLNVSSLNAQIKR